MPKKNKQRLTEQEKQEFARKSSTKDTQEKKEQLKTKADELQSITKKITSDQSKESPKTEEELLKYLADNFLVEKDALKNVGKLDPNKIAQAFIEGIPFDENSTDIIKLTPVTTVRNIFQKLVTFLGWNGIASEVFFIYYMYIVGRKGAEAALRYIFHITNDPFIKLTATIISGICSSLGLITEMTNVSPGKNSRQILGLLTKEDLLELAEEKMKKWKFKTVQERDEIKEHLKKALEEIEKQHGKTWYKEKIKDSKNQESLEAYLKHLTTKDVLKVFTKIAVISISLGFFLCGVLPQWDSADDIPHEGKVIKNNLGENAAVGAYFTIVDLAYYILMQLLDSIRGGMKLFWNFFETELAKILRNKPGMFLQPTLELLIACIKRAGDLALAGYLITEQGILGNGLIPYKELVAALAFALTFAQTFFTRYPKFYGAYSEALLTETPKSQNDTKDEESQNPRNDSAQAKDSNTKSIRPRDMEDWVKQWNSMSKLERSRLMLGIFTGTSTQGVIPAWIIYKSIELTHFPHLSMSIPVSMFSLLLLGGLHIGTELPNRLNHLLENKENPPAKEKQVNVVAKQAATIFNVADNFVRLLSTIAFTTVILSPVLGPELAALLGLWLGAKFFNVNLTYFQEKSGPRIEQIFNGIVNLFRCTKKSEEKKPLLQTESNGKHRLTYTFEEV